MSRNRDEGMEDRILETAMAVFGKNGFKETTLKDIAAGAGISTGSVYTYFADKEALFEAAATWGWDRFTADLEELATSKQSLEERLASLLGRGLAALTKALPLMRGMLFDANRREFVEPGMERVIVAIDRILDPYFAEGRAEPGGREGTRRALIGIFVTGIVFSAALGGEEDGEAVLAKLRLAMQSFFALLEGQDGRRSRPLPHPAGIGESA